MSTMCAYQRAENYRTWNNAVQVANCRSWTVNMTQDWSISWMAKCMPYSIVLLPECLGLQVKEGIMQALP